MNNENEMIDRKIKRLEAQEAELYEDAHNAYWSGKTSLCQKIEQQIKGIHARLCDLEAARM